MAVENKIPDVKLLAGCYEQNEQINDVFLKGGVVDGQNHMKMLQMRQMLSFCKERDIAYQKINFLEIMRVASVEKEEGFRNGIFFCWLEEPINEEMVGFLQKEAYEEQLVTAGLEDEIDGEKRTVNDVSAYLKDNY